MTVKTDIRPVSNVLKPKTAKKKQKRTFGDYLMSAVIYFVYALFAFVCAYPFYYIIINSISANNLSDAGKVVLVPLDVHFTNFENLKNINGLMDAVQVSVLRTVIGTALIVIISAFLGYMFTRETMWKRKFWYRFVVVTMYFNAGIIPWYLTMCLLGMKGNFWGYIFPTAIQPFYIILCKTYCESVPKELQDAGEIDGAGTLRIFFSIMLPVIKPILATIAIFAAVTHWNSFQDSVLLMSNEEKLQTLQFKLYQYIQTSASLSKMVNNNTSTDAAMAILKKAATATSISMTVTVVVVLPIMLVYPFFQRFFTKGIMIGAVKG